MERKPRRWANGQVQQLKWKGGIERVENKNLEEGQNCPTVEKTKQELKFGKTCTACQ